MPMYETPASPTPYADDGEDLMIVLRAFISTSLDFQKNPRINQNDLLTLQTVERNADSALRLLKHLPVSKDAVLEYFSFVVDLLAGQELYSRTIPPRSLVSSVEKLHKTLLEFIKHPVLTHVWSPILVHWSLEVLGDLSSKHGRSKYQINENLKAWMCNNSGSKVADVASECISRLNEDQTDNCISHLLDLSVRHGSHFDWVVAHIGSNFPQIVIMRVLTVGLKSQNEMAKVNSAVGILSHLGTTHKSEIKMCVQKLLQESEDPFVIPFFINLSSLSELMATIVMNVITKVICLEYAEKISELMPIWEKESIVNENFIKLCVNLLLKHGSFQILRHLLDFSNDTTNSNNSSNTNKDVIYGSRIVLDHLLVELHTFVHTTRQTRKEDNQLIKESSRYWKLLMDQYLFGKDLYQRKAASLLLNCIFLQEGRTLTALALQKGLCSASNDEELSSVLLLIKDVEMWMPEVVQLALQLCFRAKDQRAQFLPNLGKILHYQNEANSGDMIETDVYQYVKLHLEDLINIIDVDVLKILNFVPLPEDQPLPVALVLKASDHLTKALFSALLMLETEAEDPDSTCYDDLAQIIDHLHILSNSAAGLPMVMRSLLIGAMTPAISGNLFGGSSTKPFNTEHKTPLETLSTRLFDENLKFGSMPTHPLGTSTVFHAGVIGQGKRKAKPLAIVNETTKEKGLMFVSILFKLCDEVTIMPKDETYKQLAILLVDLVSPDVMYNGLPWPEEEFTRVTMERDLKIVQRLEDNPIIWKILWGLAEARPALCYCSVILRGALAVQLAHWSSALTTSPKTLEATKRILWLLSVGQYLPHPLDSVAEVIHLFHPYQVHCILVDLWNYLRDNVPSPMNFVTNGKGSATRKFGPYKEHKLYCERLRLIMMQHLSKVAGKYREFFVESQEGAEIEELPQQQQGGNKLS